MLTQLHWINGPWRGRLAIAARPRGGDWLADEIRSWSSQGITYIVSLLTDDERMSLDLTSEPRVARELNVAYTNLPIEDRAAPASSLETVRTIESILDQLNGGRDVVIHCRQGIGRAATIAIAVLISAGLELEEAIQLVSAARGVPVPETTEQRCWLESFAASGLSPANAKIAK